MGDPGPSPVHARINLADEAVFELGGMQVHPAERAILMNGERRELQPRVMQVLVAMARASPDVVSREKLTELCWDGRIVGDDALNRCILALRHLAQEFTPQPFAIETMPRIGHRLVERGSDSPAADGERMRWRKPAAAVVLAMLIAAGLWSVGNRWPWEDGARVPTVLVTAAVDDDPSRELARDLAVQLGSLQVVQSPTMRLIGEPESSQGKPDLVLSVRRSAQPAGSAVLTGGARHSVIWSREFQQSSGNLGDLRQQITYTAAQVLRCALEGLGAKDPLSDEVLKTYLNACAALSDSGDDDRRAIVQLLEGVLRSSPEFVAGWANLLQAEVEAAGSFVHPDGAALKPALKRHIVAARRVEPHLTEAYLAESMFIPWTNYLDRGRLLDEAVARNPNHAGARSYRVFFFASVGRMDEAVREAREAVRLNPLSPALRDIFVGALAYDGDVDGALAEMVKAERLWPGASSVIEARYRVHLRYGDPNEALRLIRSRAIDTPAAYVQQLFLEARIDPSSENVERAIRQIRNRYRDNPDAIGNYSQTLAEFDRNEELLNVLNSAPVEALAPTTEELFRPAFRKLHRDPRFMRVAKRAGLLSYWRATDKWPDFCSAPDLPYDCRREAAKLG